MFQNLEDDRVRDVLLALSVGAMFLYGFYMIDCQVKCNTIREKIFEAPRRESGN